MAVLQLPEKNREGSAPAKATPRQWLEEEAEEGRDERGTRERA